MPVFPKNNLPIDSLNWGREVEKSINNLETTFRSAEVNNVTRDAQLQNSYKRLDTALTQLTATNAAVDQAQSDAITALNTATTANSTANTANATAITALEDATTALTDAVEALEGLGSLDEATSTYKINASNLTVGTLDASVVNVTNLNASNITSGSLSADRISGGVIAGVGNITSGGVIYAVGNLSCGGNVGASGSGFFGGGIDVSGDSTLSGRITSTGTYGATTTSTANLFVASNGNFARSTSSRRYKADIQSIDYGMKALELEPRTWVDIAEYRDNGNSTEGLERIPGFIAEELHELGLTELVQYNEDGQPDAVYYDRMLVAVIPVIKNQQQLIEQLTARIEALEA